MNRRFANDISGRGRHRRPPAPRPDESGLTLVELVVVAVLLALMASVLYGTINGLIRSQNTVEERRWIGRTARYVLTQIRDDLRARVTEPVIGDEEESEAGNPYQSTYLIGRHKAMGAEAQTTSLLLRKTSRGAG